MAGRSKENKKILVHICCAACMSYVYRVLKNEGFMIIGYFYNPQVHGRAEYQARLKEVQRFCNENKIKLVIPKYDVQEFFSPIMPFLDKNSIKYVSDQRRWKIKRCSLCYSLLMSHTAKEAKKQRVNYFSTSMLATPYKDHDGIWNTGLELEALNKVLFFYRDFRKGYWNGRNFARAHKMLIPTYCGCYYSAEEGRLE